MSRRGVRGRSGRPRDRDTRTLLEEVGVLTGLLLASLALASARIRASLCPSSSAPVDTRISTPLDGAEMGVFKSVVYWSVSYCGDDPFKCCGLCLAYVGFWRGQVDFQNISEILKQYFNTFVTHQHFEGFVAQSCPTLLLQLSPQCCLSSSLTHPFNGR